MKNHALQPMENFGCGYGIRRNLKGNKRLVPLICLLQSYTVCRYGIQIRINNMDLSLI